MRDAASWENTYRYVNFEDVRMGMQAGVISLKLPSLKIRLHGLLLLQLHLAGSVFVLGLS